MNSNTFGEDDIPEAIEDLAGSLDAPDPAAIHAGLGKRQAFRRRALGGAGAFVAVLAIAGGALALTNDTTTTATAADDSVEEPEGLIFEWEGSVADDSAPFAVTLPGGRAMEVISINGKTVIDAQETYSNAPTHLVFHSASESGYPTDSLEVIGRCRSDAFVIDQGDVLGRGNMFRIIESQPFRSAQRLLGESCTGEVAELLFKPGQRISVSSISIGTATTSTFSSAEEPPWSITATSMSSRTGFVDADESADSPTQIPASVDIDECANGSTISVAGHQWLAWDLPPEWQGKDKVAVTVVINDGSLVATDASGLTAPFVRNDGQARPLPCVGFTYQQPADDASVATTAVDPGSTTTTRPPSTTTLADELRVVPDLQGYEFNDALIILFEMDFRTIRIDESSSNIESGHVIRTEPNAGASLARSDIVTIIVSSGEPKSSVPNVEAILADSAAQQLRAEGFEVIIDFETVDDPSLLNVVLSQSPPPNSSRVLGSTVTIVVGVEAIE